MRVDRKHDDDEYMQSDEHEEDSPHASRHDEDGPTQSRAVPAVRSPLRRESLPATQSDRPPLRPVKSELDMPWRAASQAHQSSSANSATQQSQSSTIFPPLGSQIVRTTEEGIVYGAYVDGEYREMTLKGPKRKRLARACAACHVRARSSSSTLLTISRRTSDDATDFSPVPTASIMKGSASISTLRAKESTHLAIVMPPSWPRKSHPRVFYLPASSGRALRHLSMIMSSTLRSFRVTGQQLHPMILRRTCRKTTCIRLSSSTMTRRCLWRPSIVSDIQ